MAIDQEVLKENVEKGSGAVLGAMGGMTTGLVGGLGAGALGGAYLFANTFGMGWVGGIVGLGVGAVVGAAVGTVGLGVLGANFGADKAATTVHRTPSITPSITPELQQELDHVKSLSMPQKNNGVPAQSAGAATQIQEPKRMLAVADITHAVNQLSQPGTRVLPNGATLTVADGGAGKLASAAMDAISPSSTPNVLGGSKARVM